MRRAAAVVLAVAVAMAAGCAGPRFPAERVGEVAKITGRWSNVYLVRRGYAALLIDSGSSVDCEQLDAALAGEPRVRAVVVTHAHADHAGCARELQRRGAAIVLGAGDVETAARGTNPPLAPTGLMAAALAPLFMFPFEPFTPDLAVEREIDLGAYGFADVHVAPAPGHTPGEVVVLMGDVAFVGDMLKGGELFTHAPTEHLYQADRSSDHAAIAAVLARPGVTALYPGHGGRLEAADVRAWLDGAGVANKDGAVAIEVDGRAELPGGWTVGLRARHAWGGRVAYVLGGDFRTGDLGGGAELEANEYPAGLMLRGQGGAVGMLMVGAGFGGVRGLSSSRATSELAVELPVGGTRLLGRVAAGFRLHGPAYDGVEVSGLLGARLGGDRRWGEFLAGHGAFLAATYNDEGDVRRYGVALGFELFTAH